MEHKPQEKISGEISLLDLFDFPDLQREILLCLARYGPADAATLAQSTGLDPAEIQQALAVLLAEGRLRALANGQVDAVIGRAKGLTTLPALLQRGAEVVLGGDWAYFWGEPASQSDVAWGRIAGLCTRDPNQSTVGLTDEEEAVTKGLLKTVYDAASRPATDTDGWAALVRPILDRIQADDRVFFPPQAAGFAAAYATGVQPGRNECTIQVRLPAAQAGEIVRRLLDACNRGEA